MAFDLQFLVPLAGLEPATCCLGDVWVQTLCRSANLLVGGERGAKVIVSSAPRYWSRYPARAPSAATGACPPYRRFRMAGPRAFPSPSSSQRPCAGARAPWWPPTPRAACRQAHPGRPSVGRGATRPPARRPDPPAAGCRHPRPPRVWTGHPHGRHTLHLGRQTVQVTEHHVRCPKAGSCAARMATCDGPNRSPVGTSLFDRL
jgi:hypothetical protein